jgi:hypothetical protein
MGIIHVSNKNVLCSEGSNKNCFSIDFGELQYWILNGDTVDTVDTLIVFCENNQHHKETLAGNSLGTTRAPAVESFLGGDQLFRNQLETFYEKNDVE